MIHEAEQVVLLDQQGRACGTAEKATVHGADTPLHLAFSCHVLDTSGRVLLTRRSLTKRAWPGTWTNAFCGHPAPAEPVAEAVRRRAGQELRLSLDRIEPVLPDFRYRAVDAAGIVENEVCPVYMAEAGHEPEPDPTETMEHRWVEPERLAEALNSAPWAFSPWLVLQARRMSDGGVVRPSAWKRRAR
ncbi:isopentenyl-diphosphate Delta-isomerase [Microbacterium sp. NPDC096154]|uniref:isopentenyl-diphosphate Delta-isomerase n=1 Tax=Microbacterium sp. NPDC096154 TaxID=3155549 RepID=UPI00332499D9